MTFGVVVLTVNDVTVVLRFSNDEISAGKSHVSTDAVSSGPSPVML